MLQIKYLIFYILLLCCKEKESDQMIYMRFKPRRDRLIIFVMGLNLRPHSPEGPIKAGGDPADYYHVYKTRLSRVLSKQQSCIRAIKRHGWGGNTNTTASILPAPQGAISPWLAAYCVVCCCAAIGFNCHMNQYDLSCYDVRSTSTQDFSSIICFSLIW